jgi:predicted anti-sigma-YlaC factor YlaD
MTCTSCGTEIAAKALICFRCGQATAAPRVTPPAQGSIFDDRRRRMSPVTWAAAALGALGVAYAVWVLLVR